MRSGNESRKLLLVLSHMRSYSTLLTHILADNPAIHGWQEQHRSYLNMGDVDQAIGSILRGRDEEVACDNLLHNANQIGDEVLESDRVEWLISVRQAPPALASLMRWGGQAKKFRQPGVASDYLVGRLEELATIGEKLDGRYVLLRSNRLVGHPTQTLAELTDALGLEVPLREEYAVDKKSGTPGLGDFSRYIKAGRIVAERSGGPIPDWYEDELERVVEARFEVMRTLRRHARAVV